MQYPPQAANNGYQGDSNPKYQQPPPNYAQNFQNPGAPPMVAGDGKQTFDQVFRLEYVVSEPVFFLLPIILSLERCLEPLSKVR